MSGTDAGLLIELTLIVFVNHFQDSHKSQGRVVSFIEIECLSAINLKQVLPYFSIVKQITFLTEHRLEFLN